MNLHEVFLAAQIANQSGGKNADLSDYYTKAQTDSRITTKVAEIVSNAPEDLDTLKEISDWIESHEDSAAAMNSAIAANTAEIAGKVDKVPGKGLSANDFTNADKSKLDSLESYDDTDVKADISKAAEQAAVNANTLGYTAKNLMQLDDFNETKTGFKYPKMRPLKPGKYILSYKVNTVANNPQEWRWKNAEGTVIRSVRTRNNVSEVTEEFELTEEAKTMDVYFNAGGNYSDFMLRDARISDAGFEPFRPTIEERLAALEEKFAALEEGAT